MFLLLSACDPPAAEGLPPAPEETPGDEVRCEDTGWFSFYPDEDADGYADLSREPFETWCLPDDIPDGYVSPGWSDCWDDDPFLPGYDSCFERWDDCDDDDPSVHPLAEDPWYDGQDWNCDDESDYDQDRDRYDAEAYGGADCDDVDRRRHPSAVERCDGDDDDCDGKRDGPSCGTLRGPADVDATWTAGTADPGSLEFATAGDTDGDGADELIVGGWTASWVLARVDLGGAVARDAQAILGQSTLRFVHPLGDVDGDGLDDVYTWRGPDDVSTVVPGPVRGNIVLDDETWWLGEGVRRVASADVDGDGATDLVGGGCVATGPVARDTTLDAACVAEVPNEDVTTWSVGDLDGDGLGDLAQTDIVDDVLRIHLAPFAGVRAESDADGVWRPGEGTRYTSGVRAGDVDGDGRDDLAVADSLWFERGEGGGRVVVLAGPATGAGNLDGAWIRIRGERSAEAFGTVLDMGDVDGDGHADLVVGGWDDEGEEASGAAWVLRRLAGGSWIAGSLGEKWTAGESYGLVGTGVATGDFDGDGDPDLAFGLSPWLSTDTALWFVAE